MMKLGFTSVILQQNPIFHNGSQKLHPDPKKLSKFVPMWKWCWLCFLIVTFNSLWISISWPDSEQAILSDGVEKAERGSEEKKVRFLKGGKNGCSIMTMSHCIPPFDLWFSHTMWDDAHPLYSVLSRPCTSALLSLHQAEIFNERMMIWVCQRE